jgi:hypothetical protein
MAQVIMMRKIGTLAALAVLALTSCGGNKNGSSVATIPSTTPTGGATVASVVVLAGASTIPSDNSSTVDVTAYVRDASNKFLKDIPVAFGVSSGGYTLTSTTVGGVAGVTDANGTVKATVSTLNDPTNRTITITASVGSIASTATVNVVGTVLTVQGPTSLTAGQIQAYTVTLNDSGAKGISGKTITVTAPSNATVSATTLTTDNQGRATFNVTGGTGGTGTLTVAGLGLTSTATITVAGDALTFSTPAANSLIALKTAQTFTVVWSTNGVPVVGQPVNFATTRGCINPPGATCITAVGPPPTLVSSTAAVTTNGSGQASVSVLSDNAGGATITATLANGTVASRLVQFVAVTAASIDVQPSVFTVAPNEQSTISAVVRDAQNNLVANKTVVFNLTDVTGGTLSVASALTDLQGRAQTVYTAGTVASAKDGVSITASVQGASPAVTKTVALTVAGRQVFIAIGTGNQISEPNTAQYKKDYTVIVTDSTGAGVKGVPLSMSVLSQRYFKGVRKAAAGATSWATCYTIPQALASCIIGTPPSASVTLGCADEDFNRNGVLDAGEDQNNSAKIEAGNIAAVAPSAISTDDNGFALVSVYYPQEYAYYLQVTLQAQAQVQGTAFSASSTFLLEGLAADFNDLSSSPPGPVSPFGKSNTCSDIL